VIRSRWPNLEEQRFLELTRRWAERERVEATVVFDGRTPDGESADDWIARQAEQHVQAGRRLWVVTSDRELRRRVEPHVERVLGGGTFAGELEELERGG
jgi:hypothetical protein